jgi:outer membrane protein assembly factor BamB
MKRSILVIALLAAVLGGCSWLKKLGTPDNVEPPTPLTDIKPTVRIDRVWNENVGGGAGQSGAHLSLAVAGNRMYAAGINGTVQAIDAASGKTLWQKRLGTRSGWLWRRGVNTLRWSGGPSVDGDLVVVGGLDGQVYALSAQDGGERWHAQVPSEVITAPAISGGIVVVRSNDGRLVGLNAGDGAQKWVFEQAVPALSLRGNSAPLIANDVVYDGFDNGRVVAVRLIDGNELWAQTLSSGEGRTEIERLADVDGNLAYDGTALYAIGYRGLFAALAPDSGRPRWQRDLSGYVGAAVSGNIVVVVDADGNVWAFDRETGVNLWKQDKLKYRVLSQPGIQDKYVVVGDGQGFVHWLSLDEGKFAARERLSKRPIENAPVAVGDMVYVDDVDGRIAAYRAH